MTSPATPPGPPEKKKDHAVIAVDQQEHRRQALADTPPNYSRVPAPYGEYDRLTREPVLVAAVSLVLIALAWAALSSMLTSEKEVQNPTNNWLRVAQTHLREDRLTQPPGANALESYIKAQQLAGDSAVIASGLQSLSARYLEMIHTLIENGETSLALETLEAADLVIPYAATDYAEALIAAREHLQQLTQTAAQQRQSAATRTQTYAPLERFQDQLQDGTPGPNMVVIPEGSFVLGSHEHEPGREADEGPLLLASIRRFAMARTEATFAEYRVFTKAVGWAVPDDFRWGLDQRPVINVSWLEARAYATWLSEQTGYRYRLPTEAEWEYAARAGTTTPFITGECLTPASANVDFRIKSDHCPAIPVNLGKTVPVGEYQPNPWGLHDLYGNVREWVQDCSAQSYSPLIADGRAHYAAEGGSCGASGKRSIRGGAWHTRTGGARTANRYALAENEWENSLGFRLVRELD